MRREEIYLLLSSGHVVQSAETSMQPAPFKTQKIHLHIFLIQHSHKSSNLPLPPLPHLIPQPSPLTPTTTPPYSPRQARKIPLPTHPLAPHRARRPLRSPNLQAAIHARAARAQGDPPARQVPPRHHLDPIRRAPRARRIELHRRVPH